MLTFRYFPIRSDTLICTVRYFPILFLPRIRLLKGHLSKGYLFDHWVALGVRAPCFPSCGALQETLRILFEDNSGQVPMGTFLPRSDRGRPPVTVPGVDWEGCTLLPRLPRPGASLRARPVHFEVEQKNCRRTPQKESHW